jgi:hypothetical protein
MLSRFSSSLVTLMLASMPVAASAEANHSQSRVMVTFDGGYDVPFGSYYQGTRSGPGFGGMVHIAVTNKLALRVGVSRLGMDFDGSGLWQPSEPIQVVSSKADLEVVRTMVGLEYQRPWSRLGDGLWFVHASLGAVREFGHHHMLLRDIGSGREFDGSYSTMDTHFAVIGGAGAILRMQRHLGVCASADLNNVFGSGYSSGGFPETEEGVIFGIKAGLAWMP